MVSEALKRSFMDFQLSCTSPFPWIWVIETLARSNQIDVSLLLDLLEKSQEITDDLGRNARELVSLRILESVVVQGASANSVSSASSPATEFNPSELCEDVLQHILLEASTSNLKASGTDMLKWNLEPFIVQKRASLTRFALQQLKDAILTGSHPLVASLKKQSGLSVGDQPEHGVPVDDCNCGIAQTLEGSDTNTQYDAANVQLNPPAFTNVNGLLHGDLAYENLLPAKRNISCTTKNAGGKFCDDHIILENGCETHLRAAKKYKHDIICSEHGLGGNLISSSLDEQLSDTYTRIAGYSEGHRCSLEKINHVGCMGKIGPSTDGSNECTSSKGLVGHNEVLPCENQVPHCDTDMPNNKSGREQGQNHAAEATKVGKEGFHDLKTTNEDMDRFEQNFKKNVPNVGEAEEDDDIFIDTDGYDDNMTDIASKKNAFLSSQCTHRQDSFEKSDWREINLLAGTSRRIGRYSEGERCILKKKCHVAGMGQNGPPGDGNNEYTSSKGIAGHDEVLLQEKQVPHNNAIEPSDKFDEEQEQYGIEEAEGDREGILGLETTNEGMNTIDKNIQINVSNAGEAEKELNIYSDSENHEERIDIATKENAFLSSQCTYSQDTDWRERNLCRKCNKGGKLLVCSSNSCPLVVHDGCLGSAASFDTRGNFYCPSCAYSQAILEYQEIMKKFSSARKDLTTFCFSGTSRLSKKQPLRSSQIELDECMEKTNEVMHREFEKGGKNHHSKKILGDEQAEPSVLSSGDNLPLPEKSVHSTSKTPNADDKNNQEEKRMGRNCQSSQVQGQHQIGALVVIKSQGENLSRQVLERSNGIEMHVELQSRKGVLCPPKTELSCQRTSAPSTESTGVEEMSDKENESSGASKYFIRYRKQERRMRLPWTSAEEETLKKGGAKIFYPSR